MVITIVLIVALLFLILLIGGARFIYSLVVPEKNTMESSFKTKALDVFVYLGIAISLITSVTNLLQILFAAITTKFVDITTYGSYVDLTQSDVRFAIASLVVMFPIYVALSYYVGRDIQKFHYKQDIGIRKVMIYCTIFVTILTLIGTLVSVIYTYLGGELSTRFGLKALSVFMVALSVFGYYFYSLRRNYSLKTFVPHVIAILATSAVLASIIFSIRIIGTPSEMRARKIDSTRLSDISRIQQEVFNRFQTTEKLPTTLTELDNAFQGYQVPTDPVTREAYTYTVVQQPVIKMNYALNKKELVTPAIFELCSVFDTVREFDARGQWIGSKPVMEGGVSVSSADAFYSVSNYYYEGDQSPFWNHKAENTCFKRVISADMYYGGR